MERDFRYLRDKYGDAGARDIFEKICIELFQKKFENAYAVQASPGDDGIDVLVGDLDGDIIVYQCKYFIDGIGDTQKAQIRESYKTVTERYNVVEWYLCVPILYTVDNHKWWSEWKNKKQQKDNVKIDFYDGSRLLMLLKECDMYDEIFDEDVRNMLAEILEHLNSENLRIYNEIIYDLNDFSDISYDDCIFVKMLESANIFDTAEYKVHLAGEGKGFVAKERMDFKAARRMGTFSQYAVAAAKEAFADAGISMENEDPFRVGVLVGSGGGDLNAC